MKWEYKTLKLGTSGILSGKLNEVQLDQLMNSLGADGWELVTAFDTNEVYGKSKEVVAVFKRPRT